MPRTALPPIAMVLCASLAAPLAGQTRSDAQPLFSDERYAELFEETGRRLPAPETAYVSEAAAEPIIELEPFIVEGDDGLLIARIRRQLELGPASIRRRVAELSPALAREARYSGLASDRFFMEERPGMPRDAAGVVPVSIVEAVRLMGKGLDLFSNED